MKLAPNQGFCLLLNLHLLDLRDRLRHISQVSKMSLV